MSDNTGIEWTDATWNPVTGCTEVSAGCDHCYAKTFAERWRGTPGHYFERGFDVQLRPDKLDQPLRWKKPRKIFVNSMSDLFHDQVPDDYIRDVFAVMAASQRHTFQVLTKRHARMRSLLSSTTFQRQVRAKTPWFGDPYTSKWDCWPLPNVWLGVSTENQQWADIRIPALLDTPAAVRFISAEPLLGPIDLLNVGGRNTLTGEGNRIAMPTMRSPRQTRIITPACLDWVIVGGESGPGSRPMHSEWPIDMLVQCQDADVPFLFKQWGNWISNIDLVKALGKYDSPHTLVHSLTGNTIPSSEAHRINGSGSWMDVWNVGKSKAGRKLLGRTWDAYPEAVSA